MVFMYCNLRIKKGLPIVGKPFLTILSKLEERGGFSSTDAD